MATTIGMPELDITFKGLGTTAIKRGERGVATLIIYDTTSTETYAKYTSVADLTSKELAKYTTENIVLIKDALEGTPYELIIFRIGEDEVLADILTLAAGKIPRNSWIAIASSIQTDQDDLTSWVKAQRANLKKKYKAVVYKATTADDMGVVNLTNSTVIFADDRGEVTGDNAIAWALGYLAGLSLGVSAIAADITKFDSVVEPEDLDDAIAAGEFILYNDEGIVKVARGVNSLTTVGGDLTEEMCMINTVEKMDLIYTDIFTAWNTSYKGKYPNILDNQVLLISAINGYFEGLENDSILDPDYDNAATVDLSAQSIANYSKYTQATVEDWTDTKIMQMTVGTKVFLKANIKITGIMEDFFFDIYM